eukprot:TRINITY_DN1557_c0_g1_i1.p1 TRINITY_DN1557_c0_g1~~TRINITY_DN1557_c0_g1_i1.p1  ORF type:complete len:961 (-),score=180.18 TRINITY_DN1557_c0_g1_i1:10-2787(-)
MEDLYDRWSKDPKSVSEAWATYFQTVERSPLPPQAGTPSVVLSDSRSDDNALILKANNLVRAYQARGHLLANLDPLNLWSPTKNSPVPPELELSTYSFSAADMERPLRFGSSMFKGVLGSDEPIKIGDLVTKLRKIYCGSIGFEYMHIMDRAQCNWLRDRIETSDFVLRKEEKLTTLDRLMQADRFENFLGFKWATAKRFGIEGAESFIVALNDLIEHSNSRHSVESVVLGMPHRGRLNVLAHVMQKPLEAVFEGFQHKPETDVKEVEGTGDVKYHLGMSTLRTFSRPELPVHLSLLANPSHLEAVNPLVIGKTRAKQHYLGDKTRKRVMSVLIHGDAAFCGQGVVYETMELGGLFDYTVGGTIHLIVNNQIGFTTSPQELRSHPYSSDVGKAFDLPIFHVNGDDPEAVVRACRLAADWRAEFGRDCIVDIVAYRRMGHNEGDQAMFTQPLMYKKIAAHATTLDQYGKKLVAEGVLTQEALKQKLEHQWKVFDDAFGRIHNYVFKPSEWLASHWGGFKSEAQRARIKPTAVPLALLHEVGETLTKLPEGFVLHKTISNIMKEKRKMFETGKGIDWATAEALAFGTLLKEGTHVHISGQDVQRGTFSHRHGVVHDQDTDKLFSPLASLNENNVTFRVNNSNLSEYGALGFALGYSMESPNALVLWEAQFGDFSNGAQIVFDQFISSGESKWLRQSGLTVLLPHGMDGNGPEHSSARLERFLAMSDEGAWGPPSGDPHEEVNWQVVNCSTPANYFHLLRRQIHRTFRKPLIVMSPKKLLRLREAASSLTDMSEGTSFQPVLYDTEVPASSAVKRLIFCSGQVYYDLAKQRHTLHKNDVAIVRIEELAPFPFAAVGAAAAQYPNAELVWCQEEHMNMGAWSYAEPRIEAATGKRAKYVGRSPSAAPATGWHGRHENELKQLLADAIPH